MAPPRLSSTPQHSSSTRGFSFRSLGHAGKDSSAWRADFDHLGQSGRHAQELHFMHRHTRGGLLELLNRSRHSADEAASDSQLFWLALSRPRRALPATGLGAAGRTEGGCTAPTVGRKSSHTVMHTARLWRRPHGVACTQKLRTTSLAPM